MNIYLRFLFLLSFVLFLSCEDITPPTISIKSLTNGSTVYEVVNLIVDADDDEGISKVEFFLNDVLILTDIVSKARTSTPRGIALFKILLK